MNRRKFIKDTAKTTLGISIPFILPSGRLFAATGDRKVEHVVFCLFAGGIRNNESLEMREGNLMPNTLNGDQVINQDIISGMQLMPQTVNGAIQNHGTLLKGFRYNSGTTLHFHGHATGITGSYCNSVNMMEPIKFPTVFEYFRKHSPGNPDAMNAWWICDQSGPFPYLQYSNDEDYGASYGSNMIQASSFFNFHPQKPLSATQDKHINAMLDLLDKSDEANNQLKSLFPNINSEENQYHIKEFLHRLYTENFQNGTSFWQLDEETINDDFINVFTACETLKEFHPNLLVVNMQDSDIGHSSFIGYCKNLHKADFALAKLWNTIQSDAQLKDNTVLIAVPEFGRNDNHNSIRDAYGRFAVDHTGDELSRRMFCLIAGPSNVIQQQKTVNEEYGESIDIVPTISHLLGFNELIPTNNLNGKILYEALI